MNADKLVIATFVDLRARTDYPGLRIERWPDEENRDSSDIDAIAGPLAIEHTSIDTVENERRDSAWFTKVVQPLESSLGTKLSFRLKIILEYSAIAQGQDWGAIRESIGVWIQTEAQVLGDGSHLVDLQTVPFAFRAVKSSTRPPRLAFSRYAPEGSSFANGIKSQVERKASSFSAAYRQADYVTVLLLESADIALMSEELLLAGLRDAFPLGIPADIDEVWYADTSIPEADTEFLNMTGLLRSSPSQPAG